MIEKQSNTQIPESTIGMDIGDRTSYWVQLDVAGEIVGEGSIKTAMPQLQALFSQRRASRVIVESGNQSRWISQALMKWGHETIVANSRKVELITKNQRKGDRVDAELLARMGRMDVKMLYPIEHRTQEQQEDLGMVQARALLVKTRGTLICHVRSSVKESGGRLSGCSTESFANKVREEIPPGLRRSLEPLLEQIQSLTQQIRRYKWQIERLCCEKYPQTESLLQIPGVGPITALTYVLVLSDPDRFQKSRDVGAYLGLVPGRSQSGSKDPQLRISKAGHRVLRSLLVNCAQYILRKSSPECELKSHGEAISERGGKNAKKRAVVAVARKLAVVGHSLWKTGEIYDPWYQSQRTAA